MKPLPLGSAPFVRPAAYLPDGTLFAQEGCCEGIPNLPLSSSQLVVVDAATGARIDQVATGFPERSHHDLIADATGAWLMYGLDNDLMISQNRARPTTLAQRQRRRLVRRDGPSAAAASTRRWPVNSTGTGADRATSVAVLPSNAFVAPEPRAPMTTRS